LCAAALWVTVHSPNYSAPAVRQIPTAARNTLCRLLGIPLAPNRTTAHWQSDRIASARVINVMLTAASSTLQAQQQAKLLLPPRQEGRLQPRGAHPPPRRVTRSTGSTSTAAAHMHWLGAHQQPPAAAQAAQAGHYLRWAEPCLISRRPGAAFHTHFHRQHMHRQGAHQRPAAAAQTGHYSRRAEPHLSSRRPGPGLGRAGCGSKSLRFLYGNPYFPLYSWGC
jgi:hypothetical protein